MHACMDCMQPELLVEVPRANVWLYRYTPAYLQLPVYPCMHVYQVATVTVRSVKSTFETSLANNIKHNPSLFWKYVKIY